MTVSDTCDARTAHAADPAGAAALENPAHDADAIAGALKDLNFHVTKKLDLDLDEMPDRLKRDLGFLDGREPHYEDDRLA